MIYIVIGIVTGFVGGLGLGGGIILIPFLVFFMGVKQQIAQSINLLSFLPMSIIAIFIHFKNKNIKLKMAISIMIPGIIGAYLGSRLAVSIPSTYLKNILEYSFY